MAESATSEQLSGSVEHRRKLCDVMQIRQRLGATGELDPADWDDMLVNYITGVQENAMPGAVTTTIQRFESEIDERGRSKRVLKWLGRSAVGIAEAGADFYVSEAGQKRNAVEVREARDSEETLQASRAKVFISPKMSLADAPSHIAKAENLYDNDAVRVSYAITDKHGAVLGRRTQSLLVANIPLEAWVSMFNDPDNIFGRVIEVSNPESALAVMELFQHLELPEALIPEGPVTIVEAVLAYIDNQTDRQKVMHQLTAYRKDQEQYRTQSERTAREWLEFDIALAQSLEAGVATYPVERFVGIMQHAWSVKDLDTILRHDVDGRYMMTKEFAATLETAKRHLLISEAAIATRNEAVLQQTDSATARHLQTQIDMLNHLSDTNVDVAIIEAHRMQMMRLVARQNFTIPGGCAGGTKSNFKNGDNPEGSLDIFGRSDSEESEESTSWVWKKGVCRVQTCPSPKPTEVGPCSVCRSCQHKFDLGLDPTNGAAPKERAPDAHVSTEDVWKGILKHIRDKQINKPNAAKTNTLKDLAEVY